jgi:two-component system, OmpR family, aerobic respiration control sensor histidine kinase ArcB
MHHNEIEKDELILKLKEEIDRLENIIALLPGHVYWLNKDNIYLGCNNLQAKAANLTTRKSIVGKTNYDLIQKKQAETLNAINKKVMASGEATMIEEVSKWSNGLRTYLSHKVPIRNAQGVVTGLLGVSFDISDRKKMEEELKLAKEQAEIFSQAQSDFIRNMEHDIRTPLSGILSVASHLAAIEEDAEKKELLSDLENASQELISYFNSIIEVSRVTQGRIPTIAQEFDICNMVTSVFKLELPVAKSKKINFILNYEENIPQKVVGDSFRTYRILLNLVSNAIKFTDQGHVKISVRLLEKSSEDIKVEFAIEDSGIGIKEDEREKIYEKFMRGNAVLRAYKGMGLGLWIVKEFIRDLNGTIQLESTVMKGSIFTCTLPFKLPLHVDGTI